MKRLMALVVLALALPAAWADGIDLLNQNGIFNQYGTVSISSGGIVSKGSQLVRFFGVVAPHGHSLGSVPFATGVLLSGSIAGGGTFAGGQSVSSFTVIGKGNWGEPKGVIFSGYFSGPIRWTLMSKQGPSLVFKLSGRINGQLWDGRTVVVSTQQTIVTTVGQLAKGMGGISAGKTPFTVNGPEPGTLGLIVTGLAAIAGACWRRIVVAAQRF